MASLTSRKFIVFLVIAFLVISETLMGNINARDALAYITVAGATYTAAEGATDIAAVHANAIAASGGGEQQ